MGRPRKNGEETDLDIIVLAGGLSPERQVSLVSGQGICRALRSLGHRAVLGYNRGISGLWQSAN